MAGGGRRGCGGGGDVRALFPPCHHFLCWGGPGAIGAMAGLKTATGESIDGSFELQVEVEGASGGPENAPDPPTAKGGPSSGPPPATVTLSLRVTGDLHVGGLMLRVVETVGELWGRGGAWGGGQGCGTPPCILLSRSVGRGGGITPQPHSRGLLPPPHPKHHAVLSGCSGGVGAGCDWGGAALIGGPRATPFPCPPPQRLPLAGGDKETVGINSPEAVRGGGGVPHVPFVLWGCSWTPVAPTCSPFRGAAETP